MINEQNINRAILGGFQSEENMFTFKLTWRDSIIDVKACTYGIDTWITGKTEDF